MLPYLRFCWCVLLWPQTSTLNPPTVQSGFDSLNQHARTSFLQISELILCCRFRGSADGLGKQHAYGHARCHPRFHERIYVVGPGLSQRPHLPPSSRLCWQVRTAKLWPGIVKWVLRLTVKHVSKLVRQHLWGVAQEARTVSIRLPRVQCPYRTQQRIPHGAFPAPPQEQRILHLQQGPWIRLYTPAGCQWVHLFVF